MSTPASISSWKPEFALERLGGDHDLFLDMMRIFLEEAPKQMQILRRAIETGNSRDAEHAAHRLKGELGYLNALEAADCARRLEDAGRDGNLKHAGTPLATLEENLEVIFASMRVACADRPGLT